MTPGGLFAAVTECDQFGQAEFFQAIGAGAAGQFQNEAPEFRPGSVKNRRYFGFGLFV